MQTRLTTTARPIATTRRWTLGQMVKAALDALVRADAAYRERQQMRRLTDDRLDDMGLTRAQADEAARWTAPAYWRR